MTNNSHWTLNYSSTKADNLAVRTISLKPTAFLLSALRMIKSSSAMFLVSAVCIIYLLCNLSAQAEENNPNAKETLLIVGATYNGLSLATRQSLGDINVVQIDYTPQWKRYIEQTDADKVIIKHPGGALGLYYKDGTLIRNLGVSSASYAYPYMMPASAQRPPAEDVTSTRDWHPTGYTTGGRIDPYRNYSPPSTKRNYQAMAPGWGYSREQTAPTKKDTLYQFMSFFPIDTVTPFNYPGTFDSAGVPTAYSLGVIPHIGGLALEMREAKKQQEIYQANAAAIPEHLEFPVQMINNQESTNPFTQDPNFIRMNPMPQAFDANFPQYDEKADYYAQFGRPLP